jgi:hypothetical protein
MQIAQGSGECLWGLIFAFSPGGMGPASSADSWIALSLGGLAAALIGMLRMAAGGLNLASRGRRFGLVVSSAGLVSAVTCLCLPTSVALCVYGWIVYTSADVRAQFAAR